MSLRRVALIVFFIVTVAIAVSWFWLLHTPSGARWVWSFVSESVPGRLEARLISGDFGAGVTLADVELELESVSLSTEAVSFAVDVDLLPPLVEIKDVRIVSPKLKFAPGKSEEPGGTDLAAIFESLALPIRLIVADMQMRDAHIEGLIDGKTIELSELGLAAAWYDSIDIEAMRVRSNLGDATADATMTLTRPFDFETNATLDLHPDVSGIPKAFDLAVSAGGNLESTDIAVWSESLGAELTGNVADVLEAPSWNVQINVQHYKASNGEFENVVVSNATIVSAGSLHDYTIRAEASVATTTISGVDVIATGNGDAGSIDIASLKVSGPDVTFIATTNASWSEPRRLKASIDLERFKPALLWSGWPAEEEVKGSLSLLLANNRLLVDDSELSMVNRDGQVKFSANIDLSSNITEAEIRWSKLQWPIADASPSVASEQGSLSLFGSPDDWTAIGRGALRTIDTGEGEFAVDARGDRAGVQVQVLQGEMLGGELLGEVSYSWTGEQRLDSEVSVSSVEIGSLFPEWPGQVSGRVVVAGTIQPLNLEVVVNEIDGSLRGQALHARGGIQFGNGSLSVSELNIVHGESTAIVDGSLSSGEGLNFDLHFYNLGTYYDELYGSLAATGRVLLDNEHSVLRIDASSEEIGFGNYRLFDVDISDKATEDDLLNTQIVAREAHALNQQIEDLALRVAIAEDKQSVSLTGSTAGIDVSLELRGRLDDWGAPLDSAWHGTLETLGFDAADKGSIALVEPVGFSLAANIFDIDRFCVGTPQELHFCARAVWRADESLSARIALTHVPIALVNIFTNTGFEFDQAISGTFAWEQIAGSAPSGNADMRLSAGSFRDALDSEVEVQTGPGSLSFDIRDGTLLAGTIDLPMPGTGNINGVFSVLDLNLGMESNVAGELDIALNNIGVVAAFTPIIDESSGELEAELLFGGKVTDPSMSGDFSVTDGRLTYLPFGLKISDVQLNGHLYPDQSIEVNGGFLAGEGRAEIRTRADYRNTEATGLELELRGQSLTVIDVADVTAIADTDLRINFDGDSLTMGGRIFIPRAMIRPHNLTASRATESDDVVIVAGELPEADAEAPVATDLSYFGELELGLGDDVAIDLSVATAEVSGSAVFSWSGPPMPIVNGRYDITGQVQAFGQVLNISDGTVRFPNVPASNPTIRVGAEREIYGNAQVKRAGILVDGNAEHQTIEAYTVPLTTEERALTLLVTGSDFDFEQGVGAIDFGTYIAPRLFLSYGVGIFDRDNVISARYDLVKGFGVKATSGQKASGVDLTYNISR